MSEALGLVLAGGGARGAFEVGVLSCIAEHLPELLARVRIVTGASVGAINATFLASRGMAPSAVAELETLWRGLRLRGVLNFSRGRAFHLARRLGSPLLGSAREPAMGLFDATPYEQLIRARIDWRGLRAVVDSGRLDAVAVACTELATGGTHLFVHRRRGVPLPFWKHDLSIVALPAELGPEHVLASTAIPFVFSPVNIGGYWYADGGVRQNVPLSPALRLGADALLAVSLGRERPPDEPAPDVFPGMAQILGKLLNGIFLDRMRWDLDRLGRINDILDCGAAAYGEGFAETLQGELTARGRQPYRKIRCVCIAPDTDIGAVAASLLQRGGLASSLGPVLRRVLAPAREHTADLASYLLFDGAFAAELIALGRAAAARHLEDLEALL